MHKRFYWFAAMGAISALSHFAWASDVSTMPWSMYQQNANHSGYVDAKLDTKSFKQDWKVQIGDQANPGLNYSIPQAVVDGKYVYISRNNYVYSNTLQAFAIKDGKQVWKKSYGEVSINPPTVIDNKVYVQTVNNESSDTALYAYDAKSGDTLFKSPTSAQWEHYLAPTVFGGHVYIDGGAYGGMYSFDAFAGQQDWFIGLDQYDMWTPAVNKDYAVAYTGGQLIVVDRITGKIVTSITDPHYQWMGYDTNFAPVLIDKNNVVGIQSGYLSLFSIKKQNVTWANGLGYIGQPSTDGDYIYASQNDGLVVVDPAKGDVKWKWFKDNERVNGQLIVTKNLVFVTTEQAVYAISKDSHKEVWSYNASGELSLGMGHLYVAEHAGDLISISVS